MSYILDALKKSDEERRRDQGPTLQTVYRRRPQPQHSRWPLIALITTLGMLAVAAGVYFALTQHAVKQAELAPTSSHPSIADKAAVNENLAADVTGSVVPQQSAAIPPTSTNRPLTVLPYAQLPDAVRNALPAMTFSFHVYSDNPARRTIIINGRRVQEGAEVEAGLTLMEITQSGVVFTWRGYAFGIDVVEAW